MRSTLEIIKTRSGPCSRISVLCKVFTVIFWEHALIEYCQFHILLLHVRGSCSIVSKLLCYHASDTGSTPFRSHYQIFKKSRAAGPNQSLIPPRLEMCKELKCGSQIGSLIRMVAPIDHQRWYERPLRT